MAVPKFQTFLLPMLKMTQSGGLTVKAAIAPIAQYLSLSEDDIAEPIASGKTKVADRIGWALVYLTKAGLVTRPARGVHDITEEGRQVLATNPSEINIDFLDRYESFRQFHASRTGANRVSENLADQTADSVALAESQSADTPDERLANAFKELETALLSDLKEQVLRMSPAAFERLIVELMSGLKYGARGLAQHVGGTGDGGLDGLITEDVLGLDSIYLQAKRYTDGTVGREKIQAFAGVMDGQSVTKGVFVTTSSFSKAALDYAARSPKHLKLIDGDELVRLMVEYGVGVRTHQTLKLKRLDTDFFSDLEE